MDDEIKYLQNSCRLCLTQNQEISIFNYYQQFSIRYSEIALILADIKIDENDNLPKFICHECSFKLILFYKFKQKCELNHCTLSALLANVIEIDSPPNDIGQEYVDSNKSSINQDEQSQNENNGLIQTINENNSSTIDQIIEETEDSIPDVELLNQTSSSSLSELEENNNDDDDQQLKSTEFENIDITSSNKTHKKNQRSIKNNLWNSKIHQCDQCKQIFASRPSLTQHFATHSSEKRFSCELCDKRFTRKNHVITHMRTHNNIRPYVCEICNRGFIKSSDLIRHMKVHSDKKDFICEICGKAFKRLTDIGSHMNSHTGNRPYSCKVCNKKYYSYSTMKKHCKNYEHF